MPMPGCYLHLSGELVESIRCPFKILLFIHTLISGLEISGLLDNVLFQLPLALNKMAISKTLLQLQSRITVYPFFKKI